MAERMLGRKRQGHHSDTKEARSVGDEATNYGPMTGHRLIENELIKAS